MRIAHFYAITPNLGDAGAARGIQTILLSLKGDIKFNEYNIQKKDLSKSEIKKISTTCDALILGGGGLFYNVPRNNSQFNFNVKFRYYKDILTMPKGFFSIGINAEYNNKKKWDISEKTQESIKLYAKKSLTISVRDYETKEFLESLNVSNSLAPCPSMFLLHNTVVKRKNNTFAFNLTSRVSSDSDLNQLTKWINEYAQSINLKPILIVHHKNEDRKCIEIAQSNNMNVFIPVSPESLMEFYKKQQFLVGMRGHSLLFATGANIPMLSLSYNKKCDAHMKLIDMQEYNIKQENLNNKNLLFRKLNSLNSEKDFLIKKLQKKTNEFYKMNVKYAKDFLTELSKI